MTDYYNRGPQLAAVAIVMIVLSIIAVSLRCYTMAAVLKRFRAEDYLAIAALLVQCALCTFALLGVKYGLGKHIDEVPPPEQVKALIWKWAGEVTYVIGSTLVKFVVGLLLLRLCPQRCWQRTVILTLLVVVGAYNLFYIFIAIFQCRPVQYFWLRFLPEPPISGTCNTTSLAEVPTYISMLVGVVGDWVLALLPISLLRKAALDRRTKISVCGILALGSLASIATIARLPYVSQLLSYHDYLANFTDLAIWSIVECGLAIIASSLATLRPLFVKLRLFTNTHVTPRMTSSRDAGAHHSRSGVRRSLNIFAGGLRRHLGQGGNPHRKDVDAPQPQPDEERTAGGVMQADNHEFEIFVSKPAEDMPRREHPAVATIRQREYDWKRRGMKEFASGDVTPTSADRPRSSDGSQDMAWPGKHRPWGQI